MKTYQLEPVNGAKSFYGKAIVKEDSHGNKTLFSYGTPIIEKTITGDLIKLWGGWSATTGRHINAFCGLNKAGFMSLPYEPTPADQAAAYTGTLYR
jgi:hypothetical protein